VSRLRLLLVGAAGAVFGLFLLLTSGILNFAASSGHWDATDLFLDMAARQSVTARSIGIHAPDLGDPRMIRRGARHYEMVCAACHGSPARPPEQFAVNLTPKPPVLVEQMQRWRPVERVFWTVKHGLKRTGMPAWATQLRDDEVWDVVAFLTVIGKLTAEEYRALAGDGRGPRCSNCHGDDGAGIGGPFPRLDIQTPQYIADALKAFRDGTRASGTMISAASGLTDEEIVALSQNYGRDAAAPDISSNSVSGRSIAMEGIPQRDIAACDSCHGLSARSDFPRLSGQNADYLLTQLQLFAALGEERGGRYVSIMVEAASMLTPAEMRELALWYAGQNGEQ
jgi:cytochrome c553